jgi:hypothetical protein
VIHERLAMGWTQTAGDIVETISWGVGIWRPPEWIRFRSHSLAFRAAPCNHKSREIRRQVYFLFGIATSLSGCVIGKGGPKKEHM